MLRGAGLPPGAKKGTPAKLRGGWDADPSVPGHGNRRGSAQSRDRQLSPSRSPVSITSRSRLREYVASPFDVHEVLRSTSMDDLLAPEAINQAFSRVGSDEAQGNDMEAVQADASGEISSSEKPQGSEAPPHWLTLQKQSSVRRGSGNDVLRLASMTGSASNPRSFQFCLDEKFSSREEAPARHTLGAIAAGGLQQSVSSGALLEAPGKGAALSSPPPPDLFVRAFSVQGGRPGGALAQEVGVGGGLGGDLVISLEADEDAMLGQAPDGGMCLPP
mmetsp:Transcript_40137/g.91579  ORF Transcript_40137/g.91579 Transcript_40137/m.91579 type:complete len:275 (+) Transcript_40137:1701-2525(+)